MIGAVIIFAIFFVSMVISIFKRDMKLRQIPQELLIKQNETLADLKRKSDLIAALPQSFMIVSKR